MFSFKPTQHQHTHTHTQKALTQKHITTQKALTHTDTRKEEGKKKPEKEKSNQKTVAEKKFKRCARHFSLFSKKNNLKNAFGAPYGGAERPLFVFFIKIKI